MHPRAPLLIVALLGLGLIACEDDSDPPVKQPPATEEYPCDEEIQEGDLVITELVANNEGVWIDESGALEDFIELLNTSNRDIDLLHIAIADSGGPHSLLSRTLPAGERILLWADNDLDQGDRHLPFKLSSDGEALRILSCDRSISELTFPQLGENDAYARYPDIEGEFEEGDFEICRYATPTAPNGSRCAPPVAKGLVTEQSFEEYEWQSPFPELPGPLAISELALLPASFIELENTSEAAINLDDFSLTIAPIYPGLPLPEADAGQVVELPEMSLAPGGRLAVAITDADVETLLDDPLFEGVVSLFDDDQRAVDRIDFMHWPEGAALARPIDSPGITVFCEETTPDAANECTMLRERTIGNRARALRTHSDFAALAAGGTELATESVKIIIDVVQGGRAHLLSALAWPLHYTFVREVIEQKPALDRCDLAENNEFNRGWSDFSVTEYFATTGRSYFLGTLVKHGATGHKTIEFTPGDEILGADMRDSFFKMASHTLTPPNWLLRPQDSNQINKISPYEGELPLLPTNAPFSDLIYQPLTQGEGFGVLTFVPASELESTALGSQTILVTDDVPNDIPLTGGLITQAFQTPLAHVNVLSQNRGTPNMALRDVLDDERISSNLGKMVRLVVEGDDFSIEEAEASEAQAFWDARRPSGNLQVPRLDTSVRELVDLKDASLDSIPIIGAKASQLAELYRVEHVAPSLCASVQRFSPPEKAFAIPVVHFLEHFEASGAKDLLTEVSAGDDFQGDPLTRAAELQRVRELILEHPVDAQLLANLEDAIEERFGNSRVRLRSSSNAEDLPGFNGAGLYESVSAELGDESRLVEDALRTVWASVMSARAYDERQLALIDHEAVSMGVLVHPAFPEEQVNGVGVSRNVLDPIRGDMYYLNVQAGEASVTNPAPGVITEELTYQWPPRTPRLAYSSDSSLTGGERVLSASEVDAVACALYNIHFHFVPLLNPEGEDPWFAMEIEFKLNGRSRDLVVKQARPHAFSGYEVVFDCREL